MMKYILLSLILCSSLFAQNKKWGWDVHGYINDQAVDHLPAEMSFFQDYRSYLQQHAIDPDIDPLPGYYHYIDIDSYPEFFTGTLPHNLDNLITLYGLSTVQNNGIVPWIIEEWTDSLSTLMAAGQWDNVWQIASELGHYVADSHQPLHLTYNYNGQFTGNDGIHSGYETDMINPHLSQLPLATGTAVYWSNVIDSVFLYIEDIYPYVDNIMIADDLARAQDPTFGITYYDILWQELEQLTTIAIHKAIIDLASLWRTAWENAGSPSPLSIQSSDHHLKTYYLENNYPNPFNTTTIINYELPMTSHVDLIIYNSVGQIVKILISEKQNAGNHTVVWDAAGYSSGVYFYRIKVADPAGRTGNFQDVKKMILIK